MGQGFKRFRRRPCIEELETRRLLASVHISDASLEEGDAAPRSLIFTITLTGGFSGPISISYATAGNTAGQDVDYQFTSGSVVFTSPASPFRQFAVPVIGDTLPEEDETFFVNLTVPVGVSVTKGQGIGTIRDNDRPTVTVATKDSQATEGRNDPAVFRFTRTGDLTQPLTVNYSTAGTAKKGQDYTPPLGIITIPAGVKFADLPILATGDTRKEPTEKLVVKLKPGAYSIGAKKAAIANIINRDGVKPKAVATAPALTVGQTQHYQFVVKYTDDTLLAASSIGNGDVLVTGPNGYTQLATLVSKTPGRNAKSITAIYQVPPPGDAWDAVDNGAYTLTLVASQVTDAAGNKMAAATMGTFNVLIPVPPGM
jgi:hypothetical protein